MHIQQFIKNIKEFYAVNKRAFAWRETTDPYNIVISEIMLQQTQTFRVAEKYDAFIKELPDFNSLACASFEHVLGLWKGLGYNRRARYVHEIARMVTTYHAGVLPDDPKVLETFPGIGYATARSIVAFAFNKPTVFIETNIRAVFLEHFFPHEEKVHDARIMPLVEQTVDLHNPREWYYALMDYGVYLKKERNNPARRSAHHVKQSQFEGSNRQVRGKILEVLLKAKCLTRLELYDELAIEVERIEKALMQLCKDKLVKNIEQDRFMLAS